MLSAQKVIKIYQSSSDLRGRNKPKAAQSINSDDSFSKKTIPFDPAQPSFNEILKKTLQKSIA